MIARALMLAALAWSGLAAWPHAVSSAPSRSPDDRLLRHASLSLKHHSTAQVERWLRSQAAVRAVTTGADGKTIDIRFRDGQQAAILPATLTRVRLSALLVGRKLTPQVRMASPGARALILEPFASELGLGPNAADVEASFLTGAGFAVDQLYDTQVTVESMKLLWQYNVSYMETHSGVNTGGEGVLATGQPTTPDDAGVAQYIQNGSVIKVGVSGTQQTYYGITSVFIRMYENQFLVNSIMFLNGCNMLSAPVFWQALQSKGLGVLVSWQQEATARDNVLGGAAFFAEMAQGQSVAGAIQAEQAAGYGKSTVNNQDTEMGYLGNGAITLQMAASSPQVQPTATSVPGTAKPTATVPVPTATPGAAPPLSFTVKHHVKPGTRQTVAIISSPNTVVHVTVDFPTGDGRTITTTTDASGHASYTFVQKTSRVTYQHVFATVTVDASHPGGPVVKVTQLYRVMWSPVDVSVLPRRQAVGGHVDIWIHARAHLKVTAVLHFPSGALTTLSDQTGTDGWVRLPYTVGRYLKRPNNHVVVVRASASLGGHTYRTFTTFTIS